MKIVKQRVMLSFPEELARKPIIYNLGQQFNIVTNVLQAELVEDRGWGLLELDDEEGDIEAGLT